MRKMHNIQEASTMEDVARNIHRIYASSDNKHSHASPMFYHHLPKNCCVTHKKIKQKKIEQQMTLEPSIETLSAKGQRRARVLEIGS